MVGFPHRNIHTGWVQGCDEGVLTISTKDIL